MATVEIVSPAPGAVVASPLGMVRVRFAGAGARSSALLDVGEVRHVVELKAPAGEFLENVTFLEGENRLRVAVDGAVAEGRVTVERSGKIVVTQPSTAAVATRGSIMTGTYEGASCPAGVISVNGFLQQFTVTGDKGQFGEKIVLRPGKNHLAVQIGELYSTLAVEGTFRPAKLLATLVWDTDQTDIDLYVAEPTHCVVWYQNKSPLGDHGNLDVDQTRGFGPENYSIGLAGGVIAPGDYRIAVHFFSDQRQHPHVYDGVRRTEWAVRILTDEGRPEQRRKTCYGILEHMNSGNATPGDTGRDWQDAGTVTISGAGEIFLPGDARPEVPAAAPKPAPAPAAKPKPKPEPKPKPTAKAKPKSSKRKKKE